MYKVVAIDDPTAVTGIRWEKDCESLQEAVDVYEGFTDWGFAEKTKVVAIMDSNGDRLVVKQFARPLSYS